LRMIDPIPPKGMHYRRPHFRLGKPVRGTFVRNNGRRASTAPPSNFPPPPPHQTHPIGSQDASPHPPGKSHRKHKKLAITITATLAIGGTTAGITLSGSPSAASTLDVQVKADSSQMVATLAKLGFGGSYTVGSPSTDCIQQSSGDVRQFLTRHPCQDFATNSFSIKKHDKTTQIAISWVVMSSDDLAAQYKSVADIPGKGNPPGESSAFNGLCYASSRSGNTVWTEQVQPTGDKNSDRKVLQATAPVSLSSDYLQRHCVS
jgi:hypothetical protein